VENNTPREKIYSALFQLLQDSYTWVYTSRSFRLWSDTPTGQQPALYMRQRTEVPDQPSQNAGLTRWHLRVYAWVYVQASPNSDEPGYAPIQALNPVLDAIDKALGGEIPGAKQTLARYNGGVSLVERVWLNGPILINDPPAGDLQIIAALPITVTAGF